MSPFNKEKPDGKQDRESVDENVPIHSHWRNGSCFREEGEDEDNDEVEDREVVDRTTPFAQTPTSSWERLLPPAFNTHAGDRDDIRREEGCSAKRGDSIESRIGANVD
jgi:hypothetical protein